MKYATTSWRQGSQPVLPDSEHDWKLLFIQTEERKTLEYRPFSGEHYVLYPWTIGIWETTAGETKGATNKTVLP